MPSPSFVDNLRAGIPQHIITYGTSLTEGGTWVSHLQSALDTQFPNLARVTNSGKAGKWSTWGLQNLRERVLDKSPDAVIIEFAINDAFAEFRTSLAQVRINIESMLRQILARNPHCQIILMTMNPPTGIHLERRPNINAYYNLYRTLADENSLLLIDHHPNWQALLESSPETFTTFVPDGIHPNPLGYEKITTPTLLKSLGLNPL